MNMVAHEVRLKVTGTHYGNSAGGPELFTEETTSVLVSESGGVIQLSTAVVPGQLLFLANVESKGEVVAQVKRRRAHNETNSYVELGFAEPVPRFWGMDFSAATALLPKHGKDVETAAAVLSAEVVDEPGEPLAPPAREEVRALRDALREPAEGAPAAGARAAEKLQANEDGFDPIELMAAEQAILPKTSSEPARSARKARVRVRARGNFTPGFRGGMLRVAALTAALVVTVIGAAWYKHWVPWKSGPDKSWMRVAASGETAKTSLPAESREKTKGRAEFTKTKQTPGTTMIPPSTASLAPASPDESVMSSTSALKPTSRRAAAPAMLEAKGTAVRPTVRATAQPVSPGAMQSVLVPPKLIKSVRAVVSLDDLRDFETGNVVIDAVVGTEGEVHFISVISGPPSLRPAAIGAVKQYRYEPAMRNGQPVPEHVNITIRFKFES